MLRQRQQVPKKSTTLFTLLVTFWVALPHASNVPPSIFAFFSGLLIYRLGGILKPALLTSRALIFGLTACGIALLTLEHRTIIGLYAGTSFFLISLGLKLLEMKRLRDFYFVIFLCFFVAITQFLYSQSAWMIFYILLSTCLLVAALTGLNSGTELPWRQRLKISATLMLQALPITLFLFVLFPRIPSPQIGIASPEKEARTGLGESMEPGQISHLSQSSEVAFRVNFKDKIPPPRERYWRGPVFWYTDGVRWSPVERALKNPAPLELSEPKYEYEIILEAHGRHWLFALELPINRPSGSLQSPDLFLRSQKPVRERISYSLTSYTRYNTGELSDRERKLGLQLPRPLSPRIERLIGQWQKSDARVEKIVEQALQYFHDEEFYYTLDPPLYPENPVESFLFGPKRGFCEHFASAFVYLMRAARIPARIVTGYQGGEFNTLGGFLEVRQSDAHAWAEVWLPKRGWIRIDPTAAVAPERIERGIEALAANASGGLDLGRSRLAESLGLLRTLRFAWASLDHAWHQWVLSYNADNQAQLLEKLGLKNLKSVVLGLIGALALCLVTIGMILIKPFAQKSDRCQQLYLKFCRKLARAGLKRSANEPAGSFALRAIHFLPEQKNEILGITRLYHQVRYGRNSSAQDLKTLRLAIQEFRIPLKQSGRLPGVWNVPSFRTSHQIIESDPQLPGD